MIGFLIGFFFGVFFGFFIAACAVVSEGTMTLIDKAALLNRIATEVHYDSEHSLEMYAKLLSEINDAPDALVRCKDCRFHEHEEVGMVWCPCVVASWMAEDGFCSMGEKRTDETANTYSIGKVKLPKGAFQKIYEERKEDETD